MILSNPPIKKNMASCVASPALHEDGTRPSGEVHHMEGLCHPISWKHLGSWKNTVEENYTSVDPKQFTVSKFRLKPVILISECFCSTCGHTNQHPPPTWRETTGDNGRQDHFRAREGGHTNQHPPPTWRETTGDIGRQDHFRAQEADQTNQHQGGQI